MKTYNLALFVVSGVTIASTIFAVKQGILPDSKMFLPDYLTKKGATLGVEDASNILIDEEFNAKTLAFSDLSKPIYYTPKKLEFLGATIDIEEVNLTPDETLEAPESWFTAGWYTQSSKTGEAGNLIIDGHYDTNTGTPAAFWGLKNLKVNDTVTLKDSMDKDFVYKVRSVFYVDIQDPDRTLIFEETHKKELTLITCGGVWDTAKHTYDKRLIVKADLVSDQI
ncbi:class F sortase [candidate division WWE3 bacterium]|nr:class F sortase [candidate division WWE3 bacterium]